MRDLSTRELIDLGHRFGVHVDDGEAEAVRDAVNDLLDPLDAVDDLPTAEGPEAPGERTWRTSTGDLHNAIITRCDVPPTTDGPLAGTTVGVKDIIAVAGVPLTCASDVMRGYIPGFDAAVVERLRDTGARISAKTNLDEFAASGRGTTSATGPVLNPHDEERTAGGSSGGSAAAVAAGTIDTALGTDTGGSIRIPAGFCGVVGLKPTYGLIPLHGVVENTYTQDHVGPISSTVADAARLLEAVAGPDERDPASLQAAGRASYRVGDYVSTVEEAPNVDDLALGVLEEGVGDGVASTVAAATESVVDRLADAGATVDRVSVPEFKYGKAVKNILSFTELAAHWRAGGAPFRRGGVVDEAYQGALASRSAARSGELGEFYKQKLLAGARIIDAHEGRPYTRAQTAREVLVESFATALDDVDVLLMPTLPDVAPRLEEAADPGFDLGRNTRAADVTRLPAVTVPNGTVDGLPVGLQLMGDAFAEGDLLAAATAIESWLD